MNQRHGSATAPITIPHRWRLAVVLTASLLLAVAQPLTVGLVDQQGSFDVFFSLLIIAVALLVLYDRDHRRMAFSVALIAFCGLWIGHAIGGPPGQWLLVGAHLLAACFFAFALYGILRALLLRQASGDALFGVVCGYLLLGIIWGLLYSALETASPGSFRLPTPGSGDVRRKEPGEAVSKIGRAHV